MKTTDPTEVRRWLHWAADRVVDWQASVEIRRGILEVLDAQFCLEYHARRHAERLEQQARDHAAKAAGTYWRGRDARRASTRPVSTSKSRPTSVSELKGVLMRRRTTLGEAVGALVNAEVEGGGQTLSHASRQTSHDGQTV